MKEVSIKIHIERDFSFAEFEITADLLTGEGLPQAEELRQIWDRLPSKDTQPVGPNGLRQTPESVKRNEAKGVRRADPPATANQRRVLERYGEWEEGMSKSDASRILSELGI